MNDAKTNKDDDVGEAANLAFRVESIERAAAQRLPLPTNDEPFAQIKWIFRNERAKHVSRDTQANYKTGESHYLAYAESTFGCRPFVLRERWNSFALVEFKAYLLNVAREKRLSTYSITGILSAVRVVMRRATSLKIIDAEILNAAALPAYRETDAHKAYSEAEQERILAALRQEILYVNRVLDGYKPTGLGRDPRIAPGINRTEYVEKGFGWKVEDNMRWYFENQMKCRAQSNVGALQKRSNGELIEHRGFFHHASLYHGGVRVLYRKWGVSAQRDENLLLPLAAQLGSITGLNPSCLLSLCVDCYVESHPLTGMPALKYVKGRPTANDKELHLELLSHAGQTDNMWLRRDHAKLVRKVIGQIQAVTEPTRARIDGSNPLRRRLFVAEGSGTKSTGRAQRITDRSTSRWCARLRDTYGLVADDGGPLHFNFVRWRPTRLTQLARDGHDYFEIQAIAGHADLNTTLRYIQQRVHDKRASNEVRRALQQIRQNRAEAQVSQMVEVPKPNQAFPGMLSDCKNPFDPPKAVRAGLDYKPGRPCTRQNMCLFCRNVVVFPEHLPYLINYRAQLEAARANSATSVPYSEFHEKTMDLIDQLLDPATSEFSAEQIAEAREQAETLDVVIDPTVYLGVAP